MARISPFGRYRAFDANGNPLAGGKLFTYEAGTSTPKVTWTDKNESAANTNPVILDADGYADVWLGVGGYKFILRDASDNLLWTVDNIDSGQTAGYASVVIERSSSFSLTVNEQNYVVVGTAPLTLSLLPAATAGDGFGFVVINRSAGNLTVDPSGSETINGAATLVISPGGSASVVCNGTAWFAFGISANEFADNVFRVVGSADATKKVAFEVDGLTTGTTRTLTVQDKSGTLPVIETANVLIPGTAAGPASLSLAEDTDNGTHAATIIAPASMAANCTLTLPNRSGTLAVAPTQQVFASGSGTYTTPAGVSQIRVRMIGGGGGGGGANAGAGTGGTGGTTTFGTFTAIGGTGGPSSTNSIGGAGGTGGSGTASVRLAGGRGGAVFVTGTMTVLGTGAYSPLGGAGQPAASSPAGNGNNAVANTGSGGGGAASGSTGAAGAGGGAGEYVEFVINNPAATYSYAVGAGGTAGAGANTGGAGGSGIIIVDEF